MNQYESTYQRLVKKAVKMVGGNPRLGLRRKPELRLCKDGIKRGVYPIRTKYGDIVNFISGIDIKEDHECWKWTIGFSGPLWKKGIGYGCIHFNRRPIKTHILSYELFKGSRKGLLVLHKCDYQLCCNPNHLFLGTHRDNTLDMIKKGRGIFKKGENRGKSKLTNEAVLDIKRNYKPFVITNRMLAEKYNVSIAAITQVIRGNSWKHINI